MSSTKTSTPTPTSTFTTERLQTRLASQQNCLPAFRSLAATGNRLAQGYVEAIEDEIRWLKWILEDYE